MLSHRLTKVMKAFHIGDEWRKLHCTSNLMCKLPIASGRKANLINGLIEPTDTICTLALYYGTPVGRLTRMRKKGITASVILI